MGRFCDTEEIMPTAGRARRATSERERRVMRRATRGITVPAALALLAGAAWAQGAKPLRTCPPDSVVSATVCMGTYKASVWRGGRPPRGATHAGGGGPPRARAR